MRRSREDLKAIADKVLALSRADEVRVNLGGGSEANTRFANSSLTTSGASEDMGISVSSYFGKRHATATINQWDDASLERVVRASEEMARLAPEDPEYVPELERQKYQEIKAYFPATVEATPEARARGCLTCIEPCRSQGLVGSGFFTTSGGSRAVANNKGLFGFHESTNASFSATVRTADGKGSGWVGRDANRIEEIDPGALSAVAIEKARRSVEPHTLEPGKYPVFLEPKAAADLIIFMLFSLDARQADEGRSFFSKPGGGNKLGENVVGEGITITSDPTDLVLLGSPFDGEGLPTRRMTWVEKGVVTNLFYSRYWAQKMGKEPTGWPANIRMAGEAATPVELLRSVDRGVLITRFWYINFVDPQTLLLTGLTRDGTFWVENGQIQYPVKNFRFNESPIAVLNNVRGLSAPQRVQGFGGAAAIPAIFAGEFTFSSLSEAV